MLLHADAAPTAQQRTTSSAAVEHPRPTHLHAEAELGALLLAAAAGAGQVAVAADVAAHCTPQRGQQQRRQRAQTGSRGLAGMTETCLEQRQEFGPRNTKMLCESAVRLPCGPGCTSTRMLIPPPTYPPGPLLADQLTVVVQRPLAQVVGHAASAPEGQAAPCSARSGGGGRAEQEQLGRTGQQQAGPPQQGARAGSRPPRRVARLVRRRGRCAVPHSQAGSVGSVRMRSTFQCCRYACVESEIRRSAGGSKTVAGLLIAANPLGSPPSRAAPSLRASRYSVTWLLASDRPSGTQKATVGGSEQ